MTLDASVKSEKTVNEGDYSLLGHETMMVGSNETTGETTVDPGEVTTPVIASITPISRVTPELRKCFVSASSMSLTGSTGATRLSAPIY